MISFDYFELALEGWEAIVAIWGLGCGCGKRQGEHSMVVIAHLSLVG